MKNFLNHGNKHWRHAHHWHCHASFVLVDLKRFTYVHDQKRVFKHTVQA